MLSRMKSIAKSVGEKLYSALPWVASFSRVTSAAGGAIFSAEKVADSTFQLYVKDHSAKAPPAYRIVLQVISFIASVNINSVTRGMALFMYFRKNAYRMRMVSPSLGEPNGLFLNELDALKKRGRCDSATHPQFNTTENIIFIFVRIMLITSMTFMFLNTDFNSLSLFDFIFRLFSFSLDAYVGLIALQHIFAAFTAAMNTLSTISFNLPDQIANTIKSIKTIRRGEFKWTPEMVVTIIAAMLSISSVIFVSYLSTDYAFARLEMFLPFIGLLLTNNTRKPIIFLSTFAGAVADLTSKVATFHDTIVQAKKDLVAHSWYKKSRDKVKKIFGRCFGRNNDDQEPDLEMATLLTGKEIKYEMSRGGQIVIGDGTNSDEAFIPVYWPALKKVTLVSGAWDSWVGLGLLCCFSVPYTLNSLFEVDPFNPIVLTYAVLSAASTASMYYFFSVRRGVEKSEAFLILREKEKADVQTGVYSMTEEDHKAFDYATEAEIREMLNPSTPEVTEEPRAPRIIM